MNSLSLKQSTPTCYSLYGNTSLDEAEIIFVDHQNEDCSPVPKNMDLINKIAKEQLILMEFCPRNISVPPPSAFISKKVQCKGWDDPKLLSEHTRLREYILRINEISRLLLDEINKSNWEAIEKLLEKYLKHCPKIATGKRSQIYEALTNKNSDRFVKRLNWAVDQTKKFKNNRIQQLKHEYYLSKQVCLVKALQSELRIHKQIIVLGSKENFIKSGKLDPYLLHANLKSRKFAILIAMDRPLKPLSSLIQYTPKKEEEKEVVKTASEREESITPIMQKKLESIAENLLEEVDEDSQVDGNPTFLA